MSKQGFVQLHRALLDWEWYSDHNTTRLFIHMLLKANHKENKWQGKVVPRGSFISGRKALSYETGLTEQQIRTSILRLQTTNELTIKTTKKYSMFSIVKWESYQGKQPSKQPTTNQQLTTNNNDNNDNKIIGSSSAGKDYFFQGGSFNIKIDQSEIWLSKYTNYTKDSLFAKLKDIDLYYSTVPQKPKNVFYSVSTWVARDNEPKQQFRPQSNNRPTQRIATGLSTKDLESAYD